MVFPVVPNVQKFAWLLNLVANDLSAPTEELSKNERSEIARYLKSLGTCPEDLYLIV